MFIPTFVYSSIPTFVFSSSNKWKLLNSVKYRTNTQNLQFKFKLHKNSKIKIKFCCKSPQQVQYNVQHVLVTYRNNIKVPYILAKLN